MNEMNDEQRKLAEDNMKLVYHVISKEYPTFTGDEDLIQCGILGLCKATITWEDSKGAFSTYACACVRNCIREELRARQPHREVVSLDCPITDDLTLGDTIMGDELGFVDYSFLKDLTEDERLVFELRAKGCTINDIKRQTGYSFQKIRKILRISRAKYRRTQ